MNQIQKLSPSCDYPAAHSMDTTWFAVDRDGHVAVFESSEGGAVPENALSDQQGAIDPFAEIQSCAATSELIYALEDLQSPLSTERHARPQKPYRPAKTPGFLEKLIAKFKSAQVESPAPPTGEEPEELIAPVLMLFADMQTAKSASTDGNGQRINALHNHAVLFKNMPIELYRTLHDQGACMGCFYMFELDDTKGYESPQYSKAGLYHYTCCADQLAAPYGRRTIPEEPLKIEQLPAEVRDELAKLQFTELSFDETSYVQPAGRTKSYCWDGGYLAEDFKTFKANPGQEAEYKECYKNMAGEGYYGEFEFEPPSG
jgi:hypothetical protein